ncbi:class I fructose-bisphosphate aldolase [Geochorda subterranea]|uniref:Fructose-bisphosphate aldolase n=1 Tax=Geochorda subterranea TaxID=3109564 RepID=A0ABZ1BQM8_9FIRM|nr:hypothetical protein [Limnochorda sp. LNt]WRP14731.1 hypothetical protein VLY81_00745 [Limnochorda sp. LNt]
MPGLEPITGPDGRTLIIAIDHGGTFGPMEGLEDPLSVAKAALESGADALIVTLGFAKRYHSALAGAPLIVRVDGGTSSIGPDWRRMRRLFSVEQALEVGARAVIAMGFVGYEGEAESLGQLAEVCAECMKLRVPLVAEMLPAGKEGETDPDRLALAARIGAEIGADLVKTGYTGSPDTFEKTVRGCFVPVVVRGGPRMADEEQVIETARGAVAAGAIGVAFGRNVWQSSDMRAMIRRVAQVVHSRP